MMLAEHVGDDQDSVQLCVFDDGPGIAAEARAALFEPFYTTNTRGTGLGLYMAREFCIVNQADLSYGARPNMTANAREGFVVRFAPGTGTRSDSAGFLDTLPVS
jgi:two-component system sensor histidine kinase PilS (NtrC family)